MAAGCPSRLPYPAFSPLRDAIAAHYLCATTPPSGQMSGAGGAGTRVDFGGGPGVDLYPHHPAPSGTAAPRAWKRPAAVHQICQNLRMYPVKVALA